MKLTPVRAVPPLSAGREPLRDCEPLLAFRASEGSRFIPGQLMAVDGGLHMMSA